ncbi:hypothetical protein [Streptomyces sp. ME19-01-6]|uniref:hypothetical protein n=1 Tax=Streptomyces sp. ME19-01-6 TaxID=3028686 RepID=UPI0029A785DE|nr:hypothetical protein [Streptomyces sp. ME19-01-6]MDX3230571.1 hypothetical protein [Streptomyces sp. ME19-01-6]
MTETNPTPAVGQIWQDNDPRSNSRKVRIVEIDGTHAVVELHQPRLPVSSAKPGRRTRIRLDRFRPTSTGYRYVDEGGGAS